MNLNAVLEAACEVQRVLEREGATFCFIGGLAVQRWGEPRFTNDVDLSLITRFVEDEQWVDFLLAHFEARYPNAKDFALSRRVVLLKASNGVGIDISLGALDFEINCVERASLWKLPNNSTLMTCSAEDLIVHKAFAARDRDWLDVDTILIRQGRKLDNEQIFRELEPLVGLKEEPQILQELRRRMCRHEVL